MEKITLTMEEEVLLWVETLPIGALIKLAVVTYVGDGIETFLYLGYDQESMSMNLEWPRSGMKEGIMARMDSPIVREKGLPYWDINSIIGFRRIA